ncbi:kinase-like domain-containing protein [Mycena pura]|uniref:non-specific serine/threonine protein kinase n=1 Tax=Mycena pura TaxID=153505 RepID=A0AAD7E244_9AGAR|nr:kinase-like domain-containing protein [Mycena pura]
MSSDTFQTNAPGIDSHLWGYLLPIATNPKVLRIDFWRFSPIASLGRDPFSNTLILPGPHISGKHASISWNGKSGSQSQIVLQDMSSNGTWVNGRRFHGETCVLGDGAEIGFGAPLAVDDEEGLYDYRYIFRDVSELGPAAIDDLYTPGEVLGGGAFGQVRLAFERGSNKVVAIKKINYVKTGADIFSEISAIERVDHPHVIKILSAHHGTSGSHIYLALEYMPGGDLLDYMNREHLGRKLWPHGPDVRGLPQNICREIMYQLCHALAHIHAIGITHRDLKPENILLRDEDQDHAPFIKVADFGFAAIQKDLDKETLLRGTIGTFLYMAPEVGDPSKAGYDHYVDSFSAGVIMFYMCVTLAIR